MTEWIARTVLVACSGDTSWYGLQPHWQVWVEAAARREYGRLLDLDMQLDRVVYQLPVEVRGRLEPVDVSITFHAQPPYETYGLTPDEYPRVLAEVGASSPHRMPGDRALCLYYPKAPEAERWRPQHGLLALIDLVRDHLFFEDFWRSTGGGIRGVWLGDEQPHGFPGGRAA